MGFIKSGLLFFSVILLFFSFLVGNLFLALTLSVNPDSADYESEFSCKGFFSCITNPENADFFFSSQAESFWKSKFYTTMIVSLIFISCVFLFSYNKFNSLVMVGGALAFSSLPFMKINSFLNFFDNQFFNFLSLLMSEAYTVFLISFSIGILLAILGFSLRFFSLGVLIFENVKGLFGKFGRKENRKNRL